MSVPGANPEGLSELDVTQEEALEDGALPVLEKYTVLKKLAAGGMAAIYVAQRSGSDEICVIKTLHDHLARDSVVGNRFLREAQVASLLQHENIARLMDAGRERGIFYLAMEFIAGHDLESMMFKLMEQRKMLPPELSIPVTLDVLAGLDYAHAYRDAEGSHLEIVHRDLSPRNVMLTYDGDVKIIDFGLARTNLGEFRTAPGMVLGTLRYMSPEQAVAEPVDRRSDLYSWAVVLYEMLSGRPLVVGNNAQEILHAVVTKIPRPLSELNSTLPKALDPVLAKALDKDREDRFGTAGELAEALREAAPGLCGTKRTKIGKFVSSMFPEDHLKAQQIARGFTGGGDEGGSEEGPAYEPTRAGQSALTATSVPQVVEQEFTPVAISVPEQFAPTNVGPVPPRHASLVAPPPRRRAPLLGVAVAAAAAMLLVGAVLASRPQPAAPEPAQLVEASPQPAPAPAPKLVPRKVEPEEKPRAKRAPVRPPPRARRVQRSRPRPAPPPPPAQQAKRAPRPAPWEQRTLEAVRRKDIEAAEAVLKRRLNLVKHSMKPAVRQNAERCIYDLGLWVSEKTARECIRILGGDAP